MRAMWQGLQRSTRFALLAVTVLVIGVVALFRSHVIGPPGVDQKLAAYVTTANSVKLPDGRMLHFVCMGRGSPTVILTAGMGDFAAVAWGDIQPDMARITRVCSWDRPGFGLSDGPATPVVTVATTTADLESALASGKIRAPYVMVGHSLGSFETLLYTDRHPDKVVGMVLVDPSFPDQFEQLQATGHAPSGGTPDWDMINILNQCAADVRFGKAKAGGPDPDHCFEYPPNWPSALRDALAAKVSNPVQYEAMASFAASGPADAKLAVNPGRNYRDMPLIVLTSSAEAPPGVELNDAQKADIADMNTRWNRAHDELAQLSTRGVNKKVPGAEHYIQRTKPQAVLDAVAEVIREARAVGSNP